MIAEKLIHTTRNQFALDWDGIHGARHWERVRENGLREAELTGATTEVVELFAVLHDSRRLSDGLDREHGLGAALFAEELSGSAFELQPHDLELLLEACRGHSDGLTTGDITVVTCWDADRLDLGRGGIRPRADRSSRAAACDPALLEWAY